MIDYQPLFQALSDNPKLAPWAEQLPGQIEAGLDARRYGDLPHWLAALEQLPQIEPSGIQLGPELRIGNARDLDTNTLQQLRKTLESLIPWRKGPYWLYGIHLDTEWRSDWKWQRVLPHLEPLHNRWVLDVGCGNGYHGWRMLEAGAARVIGIDPSPRFVVQFHAIKQLLGQSRGTWPIDVLPLGIEALPPRLAAFDTVFSMGVFYHRRSPMDHLRELKDALRPGGQLVLETLVIEGGLGEVLVPEGRYAKMNNVWFLPSGPSLESWLRKAGFREACMVDFTPTSAQEQRRTDWMRYHSLAEFLDPEDSSKTAEGHPAPIRATFVAQAPY